MDVVIRYFDSLLNTELANYVSILTVHGVFCLSRLSEAACRCLIHCRDYASVSLPVALTCRSSAARVRYAGIVVIKLPVDGKSLHVSS
jgi:hypothetical protein